MNMMICYMEKSFEPVYFGQIMYGYKERVGLICDIYKAITIGNQSNEKYLTRNELLYYVREDPANKDAVV